MITWLNDTVSLISGLHFWKVAKRTDNAAVDAQLHVPTCFLLNPRCVLILHFGEMQLGRQQ